MITIAWLVGLVFCRLFGLTPMFMYLGISIVMKVMT